MEAPFDVELEEEEGEGYVVTEVKHIYCATICSGPHPLPPVITMEAWEGGASPLISSPLALLGGMGILLI